LAAHSVVATMNGLPNSSSAPVAFGTPSDSRFTAWCSSRRRCRGSRPAEDGAAAVEIAEAAVGAFAETGADGGAAGLRWAA